jgi:hypothetical protein
MLGDKRGSIAGLEDNPVMGKATGRGQGMNEKGPVEKKMEAALERWCGRSLGGAHRSRCIWRRFRCHGGRGFPHVGATRR